MHTSNLDINIENNMSVFLRKRPNPSNGFNWMVNWENISETEDDKKAFKSYLSGSKEHCDLVHINHENSSVKLLTFLRYDYKKVLIRARYLFIDRLRINDSQIAGNDLDFAFFEPVLLCFPNLEFLGRLQFPELYNEQNETKNILTKMLVQMGDGYAKYADKLINWHRNALSHELRPDGTWKVDLNTENKYGSPRWEAGRLYLNVPHFLDSSLLQIENLCDQLISPNTSNVMTKFSQYIAKRFS